MANSMRIGFTLSNWEEMRALLLNLPPSVESRILGDALSVAAKPIVNAAKARAPVDTGALRRSITAVVKRYPKAGKVMAIIGPSRGYFRNGKRLKPGGDFRGGAAPANYAHLVEFGHFSAAATGTSVATAKGSAIRRKNPKSKKTEFQARSFILPRAFLRPAVLTAKPAVEGQLAKGVEVGMAREIKRLASKMKRIKSTV